MSNSSKSPVTIVEVSLVEAQNVELIEAVILPMPSVPDEQGSLILIGNGSSYPPQEIQPEWHQREPAAGASVPGGEARAVVFGLTVRGDAHAEAVRVRYRTESGGRTMRRGLRL